MPAPGMQQANGNHRRRQDHQARSLISRLNSSIIFDEFVESSGSWCVTSVKSFKPNVDSVKGSMETPGFGSQVA